MKKYFKKKSHNKVEKRYTYMDLIKRSTLMFSISFLIGAFATVIYILRGLFI